MDTDAFINLIYPEKRDLVYSRCFSRGTSRHLADHLPYLEKVKVLEKVESEEQQVVLHGFTVEKRSGGLRFVVDARKLNEIMVRPPEMRLPKVQDLIRHILDNDWVVLADGRSWFYQFEVVAGVRKFFGINAGGARGPFERTRLRCMCMGWSHAPVIAHRAARVLLPPEQGITWIDNFIVTAKTQTQALNNFANFMERCQWVNADINTEDDEYGTPLQRFTALGIEFDLTLHRFRSSPKWVKRFLQRKELTAVSSGWATPREFYAVFGSLVWHSYVTRAPLCFLRSALSYIRRIAALTATSKDAWDEKTSVPPSVISDTHTRIAQVTLNIWRGRPPTTTREVWSDASSTAWGCILEGEPDRVAQGDFASAELETHIYVKELFAACQAVRLATLFVRDTTLHLRVDNLPAVFSISQGHSSNYLGNKILSDLFTCADSAACHIVCSWVPTDAQRADPLTRGLVDTTAVPLPSYTLSASRP